MAIFFHLRSATPKTRIIWTHEIRIIIRCGTAACFLIWNIEISIVIKLGWTGNFSVGTAPMITYTRNKLLDALSNYSFPLQFHRPSYIHRQVHMFPSIDLNRCMVHFENDQLYRMETLRRRKYDKTPVPSINQCHLTHLHRPCRVRLCWCAIEWCSIELSSMINSCVKLIDTKQTTTTIW